MIKTIGGPKNPVIQRIYNDFLSELRGYLYLLDSHIKLNNSKELSETLLRLKGAAVSCGFVAVGRAAGDWHDAPDPLRSSLYENMQDAINGTINEWYLLMR